MSDLGFLEKLLDGAEVEWKSVADIFHVKNGYTPSKSNKAFWENGTVPWFRMDDIRENGRVLSQSLQNITQKAVTGKLFPAGSMLFATSATIGEHALVTVPHLANQRFTNLALKSEYAARFDRKFLFYYGFILADWCKNNTTKSSFASVDMNGFRKFLVPIPCPDDPDKSLAIQGEIVRILDTFTELTAELTAELAARKKQYNHYRDQLLSHPTDHVEWKPLGWVGEVRMCKRIMKSQTSSSGEIPFFKIGTFGKRPDAFIPRGLFEQFKKKYSYPRVGEVLISASGTLGRTVIFDGEEAYFQDSNIVWLENDESKVLNKYLFYFYQIAKWHVSDGGVIKRLYNDNIKRTVFPVPYPNDPERSLAEQARIVATLDNFETLTTSLSEGLPREIALRQQQYEYYRDLLLSFPKPAEAVEA